MSTFTRKPNYRYYVSIGAVPVVGVNEYTSTDKYFNLFIGETKHELNSGHTCLVFHKYQLEALQEIFGDNLEIEFNEKQKWWVCKLNKSKLKLEKRGNRRKDITAEKILELKKEGYTYVQISHILKCSLQVIKKRMAEVKKKNGQ